MGSNVTGKESEPDDKDQVKPSSSVPVEEAWIYENPDRIESIKRGIAQAKAGRLRKRKLKPNR